MRKLLRISGYSFGGLLALVAMYAAMLAYPGVLFVHSYRVPQLHRTLRHRSCRHSRSRSLSESSERSKQVRFMMPS